MKNTINGTKGQLDTAEGPTGNWKGQMEEICQEEEAMGREMVSGIEWLTLGIGNPKGSRDKHLKE